MEPPPLERASSLGADVAAELAECVFCFEPLPSVVLCVLRSTSGHRACHHLHHLDCMRRDAEYVRRHGGRDQRCPLCNAPYSDVVGLPTGDIAALYDAVVQRGSGLDARDAKDLLRAMLWLDGGAVEELVDGPWQEAVSHSGVANAAELQRLIRMAGDCAGRSVDREPPLLIDDAAGWFDFWAAEALVLTRDTLVRALIKTFGTQDEERDELRAAVGAVWGLFCGEAESISRADFVSYEGMADALLAALAGSRVAAAPEETVVAAPRGFWSCPQCTLHNPDSAAACAVCDAASPSAASPSAAARRTPASRADLTAGIRTRGTPRCYACGSQLSAGRVHSGAERSARCAQCRRRPPSGAAVWLCQCGAAKCVRCVTIETSADAPAWMQRSPSRQDIPIHGVSVALEPPAVALPVASEPEALPAAVPLAVAALSLAEPEANASHPLRSAARDSGAGSDEPLVECPHCRRRRAPAGTVIGRRSQWCLCVVDDVLGDTVGATPETDAAMQPAGLAESPAGREPAECVNCRRPPQPEGWVGVNWRRWCQCNGMVGEDLREHMRRRQRLRNTGPHAASSLSAGSNEVLVGAETLRPEEFREMRLAEAAVAAEAQAEAEFPHSVRVAQGGTAFFA